MPERCASSRLRRGGSGEASSTASDWLLGGGTATPLPSEPQIPSGLVDNGTDPCICNEIAGAELAQIVKGGRVDGDGGVAALCTRRIV